jgi:hypothetical protein
MTASFSLRQALRRQAENDIEALARFRYQALRMIFDLLYIAFMAQVFYHLFDGANIV